MPLTVPKILQIRFFDHLQWCRLGGGGICPSNNVEKKLLLSQVSWLSGWWPLFLPIRLLTLYTWIYLVFVDLVNIFWKFQLDTLGVYFLCLFSVCWFSSTYPKSFNLIPYAVTEILQIYPSGILNAHSFF